jgi:hypothetical protein
MFVYEAVTFVSYVKDCGVRMLVVTPERLPMNSTLSPATSPKVRRKPSTRRGRAASYLPPGPETHVSALNAVRTFLKGKISYDAFPVSFRIIVLDQKLEVKRALQCLLNNGAWSLSICGWCLI